MSDQSTRASTGLGTTPAYRTERAAGLMAAPASDTPAAAIPMKQRSAASALTVSARSRGGMGAAAAARVLAGAWNDPGSAASSRRKIQQISAAFTARQITPM